MGDWSSEAQAIETGEPVIMKELHQAGRIELPELLKEHGVIALVNVPIFRPGRKPYGLL